MAVQEHPGQGAHIAYPKADPLKINRFRQLSSLHAEPVPGFEGAMQSPDRLKITKKGDIVHSERRLDEVFPNKFHMLTDEELSEAYDPEARKLLVNQMIHQGPWAEDDRRMLERMPETSFRRVYEVMKAFPSHAAEEKATSNLGEDVTSSYPSVVANGLKAFKNARDKIQITTKTEPNKPLNVDPLESKGVAKFVEFWLKENK